MHPQGIGTTMQPPLVLPRLQRNISVPLLHGGSAPGLDVDSRDSGGRARQQQGNEVHEDGQAHTHDHAD